MCVCACISAFILYVWILFNQYNCYCLFIWFISIIITYLFLGDIAFRFLQAVLETNNVPSPALFVESEESNLKAGSHAVVFDMNEKMLSVCREKAKDFGLDKREFIFNIKYHYKP